MNNITIVNDKRGVMPYYWAEDYCMSIREIKKLDYITDSMDFLDIDTYGMLVERSYE